ncbi:putative N-acetylserotonin O-methyltransferase-like protein-like [Scophthalmus maximus]|uniref:Putative N-acetylserotonin O-methyltransferase-like protein-like n=1 Tax=Scophthalmus maximus TaxID=52904 RepID=A0A2U9CEZ4_SCOMX|nr:putative N-acetylserotonin O-methyltransferase-like protein-like [Scophthalmus maximus]
MTGNSSSTKLDNATLSLFESVSTSVIVSVIYMIVTAINLVGNGLSMWLLVFRTWPKSPSIIFMINLTLTDLALGAALPFQIAYQLQGYNWNLGPNMCSVLTLVFYTNMYCSILTMMAIGIDRYLGIVRPMLFRQTRKRKSIAVFSCLLMWGIVLSVLWPLMTTDLTFDIPELGITTCFDVLKKDMLPSMFAWAAFLFSVFLLFLLPFCVTIFCYVSVIHKLSTDSKTAQKERAIRLAATVLLVFILCFAPNNILLLAHTILRIFYKKSLYMAYKLTLCFSCLNSCLDPFIYYFASKEFRQKLREIMNMHSLSSMDSMKMEPLFSVPSSFEAGAVRRQRATMVLNPVISKLSGKLVVLASASPRRLDILHNAGLRFEVVPSWFKETLEKGLFKAPHEYAVETARQKALEVARRMPFKHLKTPDIVIGADTIVSVDGLILEKPVDKHDAYRMLSSLSGKEHSVVTGVAIVLCHENENEEVAYQLIDFYEETKVKFADLSEDMLWEYINSGEPMDKAGGYGIQALGGMLVEYVHGDFLNVVGFPLNHFCKQLDLIYNRCTSSLEQESASDPLGHSVTQPPSIVAQPPPNLSAQCSSSAKHNSSPSPRPNSPSANQTHHGHDGHSFSPVHKVKRKGSESEVGDSSGTLVNSLSKHTDDSGAALRDSENTTLPLIASRGQVTQLSGMEHEDSGPKKEELQRITDLMDGFKASKALFTASKLCVFDLLHSRPGLDAAQMAQEIKASAKGTERLLEACVSLGLLKSEERTCQKPVYENTDLAKRFLRSDAPYSLHGYIQHCDNTVWPLFSHLESAVREGTHQHERAFGKKSNDVFQDNYYKSQEIKLRFLNAMHSIARVTGKDVATAFDLSTYKTACDVGGCTGAMAYEFTKAHPGLSVTVFDLPAVVEMNQHFHPLHEDNRVSFVAGDFFKDELPKADLYILARILHDWPDEKVHMLLSKIAQTCTPGCGLLLSEIFLDEDRGGPSRGLLQALSMGQGKQRSAADYSRLLKSHGFITAHVRHMSDNFLDAMLCVKVTHITLDDTK